MNSNFVKSRKKSYDVGPFGDSLKRGQIFFNGGLVTFESGIVSIFYND